MYSPINEPVKFTYRAGIRFQMVLALAAVLLILVSFVLTADMLTEDLWVAGVFVLFLPLVAWQFVRRSGSLTIDSQGLRRTGLFGNETSLAWSDLAVRHSAVRSGLLLSDSLGGAKIEIDPELEGFAAAVEMVRQARPDLWRATLGEYRKRFSLLSLGLVVGLSLVMLSAVFFLFLQDGAGEAPWIILLIVGILFMMFAVMALRMPLELRLQGGEMAVRFITGEKRLQASEVAEVTLEAQYAGRNGRIAVVTVRSMQGRNIRLSGQFGGGAEAYCLLKTWLEDQRKVRSTGG